MASGFGTKRGMASSRKDSRDNEEVPEETEIPEDKEIPELHQRVALRAYQLYETRGRGDGRDLEDWFQAEQEVLSERMDTDLG
jgi:hypothetical protein